MQKAQTSSDPVTESDPTCPDAEVLTVRLNCVIGISAVRLLVPSDLRSRDVRNGLLGNIEKVQARVGGQLPQLDPIADMRITDKEFLEIAKSLSCHRLFTAKFHVCQAYASDDHAPQYSYLHSVVVIRVEIEYFSGIWLRSE
ncbi:unnamed protein product [Protopolystoma xenopodis]|uniref:Exosome RNA helicase MTR4-like beta-barrel domain-containing protein n=1 Tax=Protopolystoma xenopodis TaxID=117903 RepID=A0A448XPD0_9PLAT|nr:unnamed protein product [Protopolystoma xenopodis]